MANSFWISFRNGNTNQQLECCLNPACHLDVHPAFRRLQCSRATSWKSWMLGQKQVNMAVVWFKPIEEKWIKRATLGWADAASETFEVFTRFAFSFSAAKVQPETRKIHRHAWVLWQHHVQILTTPARIYDLQLQWSKALLLICYLGQVARKDASCFPLYTIQELGHTPNAEGVHLSCQIRSIPSSDGVVVFGVKGNSIPSEIVSIHYNKMESTAIGYIYVYIYNMEMYGIASYTYYKSRYNIIWYNMKSNMKQYRIMIYKAKQQ